MKVVSKQIAYFFLIFMLIMSLPSLLGIRYPIYDPSALRNLPPKCDAELQCNECPSENSSVENGCIQITLDLGKTAVTADQMPVALKVYQQPTNENLGTPNSLHLVMGYTLHSIGPIFETGKPPASVDFVRNNGGLIHFTFTEGSSIGIPDPSIHTEMHERVQCVDEHGYATTSVPVYYDLYPGDGSVWRFLASKQIGSQERLVSYTNPRGRTYTIEDLGIETIRWLDGAVRQVLTPTRFADILYSSTN